MKLLLEEIVEHPDADHVLRTLEYFLREISLETSRTEDELIVYGLGPSFRTMNPKDKTTVRATSQSSATTLHAEANFLASALAGDAAQDEIVRSKIERAFESLKTELRYGAAPRSIAAVTLPPVEPAEPSSVVEAVPLISTDSTSVPVEIEENQPTPIDRAPDLRQPPSLEAKPEPQPELKIEPKQEPKPDEPVFSAPRRSSPVSPVKPMRVAPARKRRSAILWVLPLLLILLAAAGYLLEHRRASQSLFAAKPEENIASSPVENKAITPAPAAPTTATAPTPPPPAAMPTDIKDWVQAWAAAMRTRDVQAQLAFYATPLDRYFLTPNVGREQLLKDKQAEIEERKGVWTFKAENVVVQKQTSTNAVVYLNKHIIAELPSSTIREERLKAQLKLKMVDGEWKIISERTIG